MKKDFRKLYWTVLIICGVLASIFALGYALTFKKDVAIDDQGMAMTFWNLAYWTTVVFITLSIIFALGFALVHIVKGLIAEPKKQMGIIIGVSALVIVFIVSYALSSGADVSKELFEKTGADYSNSKIIGASLYTVYALFAGVILAALYAEVAKKIK